MTGPPEGELGWVFDTARNMWVGPAPESADDEPPSSLPLTGKLRIYLNRNVQMTRNKAAAQAVHAALAFYGIEHGAVVVLDGTPAKMRRECAHLVHDAGRTELRAGTMTAGVIAGSSPTPNLPPTEDG